MPRRAKNSYTVQEAHPYPPDAGQILVHEIKKRPACSFRIAGNAQVGWSYECPLSVLLSALRAVKIQKDECTE